MLPKIDKTSDFPVAINFPRASTGRGKDETGEISRDEKIYFTARGNWNCYYDWFPMLSMFLVAYISAARSHSSIRDKLNFPFIIFIWENVLIEETHFEKRSYHCKNRFQLCKHARPYLTCQTSIYSENCQIYVFKREIFQWIYRRQPETWTTQETNHSNSSNCLLQWNIFFLTSVQFLLVN